MKIEEVIMQIKQMQENLKEIEYYLRKMAGVHNEEGI